MKRIICLVMVMLLCASFVCTALAAEEFVPSISYKGIPEVVAVKDANGDDAYGVLRDATGAVAGYVYEQCMLLTPVANAATDPDIPAEAKAELLSLYEALANGTMQLPYGDGVDADAMVIRDLFDVSWLCTHGHNDALIPEGVVIEMTFDIGIDAEAPVVVMTYKNNAWGEIAKVVNNGDGTVTFVLEDLCPVAFAIEA